MRKVLALAVVAGLLMVMACDQGAKPTVTIVYPSNGATIGFGGTIIKAIATDDNGVTKVEFFDGSSSIGEDNTPTAAGDTFSVSWSGGAAGSHTLKAVATNDDGKTAEHSITVTVSAGNATHHSGEIDTNEVWYPAGNPHILDGSDVYTGDNVTLTIMPGCYVQFAADIELYCGYANPGSIIAVGKADSMITFTSLSDTVPGFWTGIGFYGNTISTAKMSYCNVLFGGKVSDKLGAVRVDQTNIKFDHNLVRKSGGNGVWVSNTGYFSDFTNNTITGSTLYAVHIGAANVPTIGAGNTLTGNTKNGIEVFSSSVQSSGTWLNHGVPYVVTDNVDISNDATVTIEAGCTLAFNADVEFYCGYGSAGSIIAIGTAASPITFTGAADTVAGVWRSLGFYGNTISTARLSYVVVEDAGGSSDEGAIIVNDCNIKMDHCTLRKNATTGVYCGSRGYFADFSNNTITTSGTYPIRIDAELARTLGTGNTLTGNTKNAILVQGMNIKTTGTWLNQGVPYIVDGDIDIADNTANPVLTIAAGTTVQMQPDGEFYIGYGQPGGLIADSVTFTSSVVPPSAGDWDKLSFYGNSINSQCQLTNCRIQYSGKNEGNLYISDCTPTITGCDIGYSSTYGIYLTGSEHPTATQLRADNTIHDYVDGDIREP